LKVVHNDSILEVRSVLSNKDYYSVIEVVKGSFDDSFVLKSDCRPIIEPRINHHYESTQNITIPISMSASGSIQVIDEVNLETR
jgi:hypothetical protein